MENNNLFYKLENFEAIFSALSKLKNPEDINREFPSISNYSSYDLLEALSKAFTDELYEYESNRDEYTGEELSELYEIEVSILKLKIDLCQKRMKDIKELEKEKKEIIESDEEKKTIIFAKSSAGNRLAVKDISKISDENYNDLKFALEYLSTDKGEGNPEIRKKMATNSNFSDIYETKKFQMRVYYQILGKNIYYVIGVLQKKDDLSHEMRTFIDNRKKITQKEKEKLTELFKKTDPESVMMQQQIIDENEEVFNDILEMVEERKK